MPCALVGPYRWYLVTYAWPSGMVLDEGASVRFRTLREARECVREDCRQARIAALMHGANNSVRR